MNQDPQLDTFLEHLKKGEDDLAVALTATHPELLRQRVGAASLLMITLYYGRPQVAQALGAQLEKLEFTEQVALGDRQGVLRALAEDPQLVDSAAPDGFRPLHLAAFFGHKSILAILIAHGAEVDAKALTPDLQCPLHSAAASRDATVVQMLLSAGADPNGQQRLKYTALHSAAAHGNRPMIQVLLAAGADPTLQLESGETPRDLLPENAVDCLQLL